MTVTTRFAPSPTGRLHVGNIRKAPHNAPFVIHCGKQGFGRNRRYPITNAFHTS